MPWLHSLAAPSTFLCYATVTLLWVSVEGSTPAAEQSGSSSVALTYQDSTNASAGTQSDHVSTSLTPRVEAVEAASTTPVGSGIVVTYGDKSSKLLPDIAASKLQRRNPTPPEISMTYEDATSSDIHPAAASPNVASRAPELAVVKPHNVISLTYDISPSGAIKQSAAPHLSFNALPSRREADSTRTAVLVRTATPTGGAEVNGTLPGNSTVLGQWEAPRNRMLLIMAMLLNTMVASSLYLAARVQSRDALVSGLKGETKQKDIRQPLDIGDAGIGAGSKDSDQTLNTATTGDAGACSSTAIAGGQCRGFEAPSAWRDPTVDLQIGDTSLEAWSTRRRSDSLRRLGGCACVTTVLLCVEVSVGVYIGSLALMSNGFHLLTDVAMYASLFVAVRESDRAADRKSYSFGVHRLEVVGVLVALIGQYIITANLLVTASQHLWHPHHLIGQAGQIICLTATGSLVTNSSLAYWVGKTCNVHSHSHVHGGMASRMAWLHLVSDAVQNSLVILTGGLLWIDHSLTILDTLCTFTFAILVVGSSFGILRQLLGIVMERAPEDVDCERMFKDLETIVGVKGVHCCHAWSIAPGKVAMSAHMHVSTGMQDEVLENAQIILKHRYGILHTTLQISDDEDLA